MTRFGLRSGDGRYALGQLQKRLEPAWLGVVEYLHVLETIGAALQRTDGARQAPQTANGVCAGQPDKNRSPSIKI